MLHFLVFVTLLLLSHSIVATEVSIDETIASALNITTDYNSGMRPSPDKGLGNTIGIYAFLNSLMKADSTAQEVTAKIWIMMQWTDKRVSWLGKFNSTYDSVDLIVIPGNMLWQPNIFFYEALEMTAISTGTDTFSVTSDGIVTKNSAFIIRYKCRMQMKFFPFDVQSCGLKFFESMQNYERSNLQITKFTNDSSNKYATSSNEFKLCEIDFATSMFNNIIPTPEFKIAFQRIPTFYIVNLMLPCVLLLAVSALAFRLPPDCGERVSFSITIVLSMCVFLQLAGNYTPTQSESVPLLTWFFSLSVLVTMATVLCNVFVLDCHAKHRCSIPVTSPLIRALFLNQFVTGRLFRHKKVSDNAVKDSKESVENMKKSEIQYNEWEMVVKAADYVFFYTFASLTIIIVLTVGVVQAIVTNGVCVGGF